MLFLFWSQKHTGLEKRRYLEFFEMYDLIDTRRYWLNRYINSCLVDDGKIVVID